jgi:hypothetical protein
MGVFQPQRVQIDAVSGGLTLHMTACEKISMWLMTLQTREKQGSTLLAALY